MPLTLSTNPLSARSANCQVNLPLYQSDGVTPSVYNSAPTVTLYLQSPSATQGTAVPGGRVTVSQQSVTNAKGQALLTWVVTLLTDATTFPDGGTWTYQVVLADGSRSRDGNIVILRSSAP